MVGKECSWEKLQSISNSQSKGREITERKGELKPCTIKKNVLLILPWKPRQRGASCLTEKQADYFHLKEHAKLHKRVFSRSFQKWQQMEAARRCEQVGVVGPPPLCSLCVYQHTQVAKESIIQSTDLIHSKRDACPGVCCLSHTFLISPFWMWAPDVKCSSCCITYLCRSSEQSAAGD